MMFFFLGWLLFLELCMTLALLLSLGTLTMIAAVVTRYPQRLVLKYEYMLSAACFLATSISGLLTKYIIFVFLFIIFFFLIKITIIFFYLAILIFFTVILFPLNCWRRDWLMYPMFNHLSWSFYLAIVSGFLHAFGAWYLYKVC